MRNDAQSLLAAAKELPSEQLPVFLGELETIRCTAMARLTAPVQVSGPDELLNVEEAAARLGMGKDYIYTHSAKLPFTRRMGRKLMFSSRAIDEYIKAGGLTASRKSR